MDLAALNDVLHGAPIPTTIQQASSRDYAKHLDSTDSLSYLRSEFNIPTKADLIDYPDASLADSPCIYFCGNSLGLQPKRTNALINAELEIWAQRGVIGHFRHPKSRPWVSIDETVTGHLAGVVGALPREVVAMGSLTANVHLLLAAFYKPTRERFKIIIEGKAFPSDHYAVVSQLQWHGFTESEGLVCINPIPNKNPLGPPNATLTTEQILKTVDVHAHDAAVLLLPGVQYYTGQAFDISRITRYAQGKGLVVGWDLAHAAGNIPLELHEWGVDFAAWCSYKYLNSGPGGIAGIFVHDKHDLPSPLSPPTSSPPTIRHRLAGWWGHDKSTRFQMSTTFLPLPGASGYQLSNPSVLDTTAHLASLELFSKATPQALWEKSRRLTSYLYHLLDQLSSSSSSSSSTTTTENGTKVHQKPFYILTPPSLHERGSQLSLWFPALPCTGDGHTEEVNIMKRVFTKLEHRGIVVDSREPDVIRVAPCAMYNTFGEVWEFVKVLAEVLGEVMEEVGKGRE